MADRISDLPEAILSHILSFLPTKQAVVTSILSKRWKQMWRLVPTLDFYDANYFQIPDYRYPLEDEEYIKRKKAYSDFFGSVSAVLLLRDWHQPIKKFRLRCSSGRFCDYTRVGILIHAAMQRSVEHIHLSLPYGSYRRRTYPITPIMNCNTLVVLKLENLYLQLPSSPHFPSLKILHMENVELYDHLCLSKLIFGCPILEDLKKSPIYFRKFKFHLEDELIVPIINCNTLVVLKLQDIELKLPSSPHFPSLKILHAENLKITITVLLRFLSACPVLEDLKTNGLLVQGQSETTRTLYQEFEILPKLVRASICRHHVFLLKAVTNAKFLQITELDEYEEEAVGLHESDAEWAEYFDGINRFYKYCVPVFHNLTHMKLNYRNDCTGIKVVELLQSCPKLQVIVINKGFASFYRQCWSKLQSIPTCISLHLMTCCLNNYQGLEDEFQFANYIMQNAKFLQTMTISCSSIVSQQEKFKIRQRLSMCTRCSAVCKLSFE